MRPLGPGQGLVPAAGRGADAGRARLRRQPPRLGAVRPVRPEPRADRAPARRRRRAARQSRHARRLARRRRAGAPRAGRPVRAASSAASELAAGDVEGAIRLAIAQGSLFDFDPAATRPAFEEINLRKRPVRARTTAQDAYIRALRRHALVFGTGPAGTGKTWLAVAHAVSLFERKEVDRIILSRPAVEAGERLGFLPGDMREKVDPYLRPVYDALYDLMDARIVERAMQTNEIEIAPLAFMRGRTLSNAVVILDEAQNTTAMQMKMFLTRLGENSRMIVTGDPSQVDLPPGQMSGLRRGDAAARRRRRHRPRGVHRRGRDPPRAGGADRRGLRQGRRRAQARDRGVSRAPSPARPPQAGAGDAPADRRHGPVGARGSASRGPRRSCEKPIAAAAKRPQRRAPSLLSCSTDDSAIRALNRDWRGHDAPTNVLSFPAAPSPRGEARDPRRPYSATSSSPIRRSRARRAAEGKPFKHHLAHLAVHGYLHLLGYDHENDRDAQQDGAAGSRNPRRGSACPIPMPTAPRPEARHA